MDTDILRARFFELITKCEKLGKPCFLGFLSEEEAAFLNSLQKKEVMFFGGSVNAERVFLGAFPENIPKSEKAFPIKALALNYRKQKNLTHRDFLGSVLALGIKREAVGDILIEDGRAVLFVSSAVAPLILSELKTVGREGVTVTEGADERLPEAERREQAVFTVSSLRLDCVIAAVFSLSRNSATEFIQQKLVRVNSIVAEKPTKQIFEGDKISLRGKGKFTLKLLNGETKKGRLKIIVEKYGGNK